MEAKKKSAKLNIREIVIFGMLGAIMFATKFLMEALPNIHLVGMFIMAFTLVYRAKALWPIYVYVFLDGLFSGFAVWWLPYLYIWLVLWGITMLLPKNMPRFVAPIVYSAVCGLHGLLFGILYAPFQAICYGMTLESTIAWIIAGFPFDLIHGISNAVIGMLIIPLTMLIRKFEKT